MSMNNNIMRVSSKAVSESGDGEKKLKKSRKSKIVPYEKLIENGGLPERFEMNSVENEKDNSRKSENLNKFKQSAKLTTGISKLRVIANVKTGVVSKWKKYAACRRVLPKYIGEEGRRKAGGQGLDDIHEDFVVQNKNNSRKMVAASNRALIQYFAKLGQSKSEDEIIDLDFVESLLHNGAKIDCTDKYGQTIFHEVARAWHVDVARFLIEHGANINVKDNYGRSPLHVAAAVDYPDMTNFLIEKGADKEAKTKGEEQTPVHFAAKNDACTSLRALIKQNCEYKRISDYKGRTPLHLAAELDRSETARLLLELGAPAGVTDNSGQSAIVWMITKMAPVAKEALDQFHTTDRANRKQYYFMNHMEPEEPGQYLEGCALTPLQVAVRHKQYDLLLHPMFRRLISIKWQHYARYGAWLTLGMNFTFIMLWTSIALIVPYDQRYKYTFPDDWWRVLVWVLAVALWAYQIIDELMEVHHSNKSYKCWKEWRLTELERDIEYSHPRWPEEEYFLQAEKLELDKTKPQYFNDFWNIFDWICYVALLASIITHIIDIADHSELIAKVHIRIMAINIIILWLRLMKNARAFQTLGPFIVILGHMIGDVLKFLFLYLEFFIPFTCAFWMIFGGQKMLENNPENLNGTKVSGFETPGAAIFSMYRITLVDEYDFDGMLSVDSIMAYLLLACWLGLSAILCLNLFIALLSDTFQRVFDNANANAVMQKAQTILNVQDGLSEKRRNKFREFIHKKCAPEKIYYDDDASTNGEDDLKKATLQIRDELEELKEWWHLKFGTVQKKNLAQCTTCRHGAGIGNRGNNNDNDDDDGGDSHHGDSKSLISREKFENEIEDLRNEIRDVRDRQEDMMNRFKRDVTTMKSLLFQIAAHQGVPGVRPSASTPISGQHETPHTSAVREEWVKTDRRIRREGRLRKRQTEDASLLQAPDSGKEDNAVDTSVSVQDSPAVEHQEPLIEVHTSHIYETLPAHPAPRNPDSLPPISTAEEVRVRPTVLTLENMPNSEC